MQTRQWVIRLCVLATATTAQAAGERSIVIPAAPSWSAPTPASAATTTRARPTTTMADYFVGEQWVLAGGAVSVRERVAVLLEIDLKAGVVRQVVLPEGPGAPAAGLATTFSITSWTQQGSLLTLRATRPRRSGGTHVLQLSVQGATSSTHEVWANQHGAETRSIIRTATRVARFVVDHDADGLDGLARRLDFERRLER